MSREPISANSQAAVLLKSRRRCCICFGLNRDTSLKQGQIAHLDGNSGNSDEDNLAFLCFDHHDQFDSTTRQSKNFTTIEVKRFRTELHATIEMAFAAEVQFGDARGIPDNISGQYVRGGDYDSADLKVQRLANGQFHVRGIALWGTRHLKGPHLGQLDFIAEMKDGTIEYSWGPPESKKYRAVLQFSAEHLTVADANGNVVFGMNVNFSGEYTKVN